MSQHAEYLAGEAYFPRCDEKIPSEENALPLQITGRRSDASRTDLSLPAGCRRDFFPQRIPLKLDGGSFSSAALEKKMLAVARAPSFSVGEIVLRKIGDIKKYRGFTV